MNVRRLLVATGLALTIAVESSAAQVFPDSSIPVTSDRKYTSGSITLKATGSLQINQAIANNIPASVSDGEMTWLQFGVSGSAPPNALVTYGADIADGVGIVVGEGKVS